MTPVEPPTVPVGNGSDPDGARARRRAERRRARRRARIAVAGAAAVVVVGAGALLGTTGGDVPSGVSVGGVDVGGLDRPAARARLADRADEVMAGRITLTTPLDPAFSMRPAASALSSGADVDGAVEEAVSARGFLGRAFARLGLAGDRDLPLRFTIRDEAVARLVRDAEAKLGRRPVSATVAVANGEIVTTPARAGRVVDRELLATRLGTLPDEVEIPAREADPPADDADARRARELAERIVATPREVTLGAATATLDGEELRSALRFPVRGRTIAVTLDPDVLRAELKRPLGIDEHPPADARLEIRGNRVVVIPAVPGHRLNAAALGAAIVGAPDTAVVAAAIATTPPALTTAEARALRITEKVSEFTTPYQCCQPRVTNIQRAAAILDGTIIPAGARFSLNDALGERTAARGFVKAPAIAAGELVDSFGGGVSQVATTTYNAAFFAGLALETHTPHEFYISRYPMGREATVSWRRPDLVFRNDWPAAILMSVRAGSNGVTVAFYSSKLGRRVETTTGTPTDRTAPKTIERDNPDLPPGTRKVVQSSGPGGFSITYTRKVYRGRDLVRDETFRWRYRPENAIVEVGPAKATPDPSEEPKPVTPAPASGGAAPRPTTPQPTTPAPGGVPPPPVP